MQKNSSTAWKKLLTLLRARTAIGGLEVSDATLRYAAYDGKAWKFAAVSLPPGVMQSGKVLQRDQLIEALRKLHGDALKKHSKRQLNVVVSLSSVNVYSQVFSLPILEGESLENAVALNLQMISPSDINTLHAGWQPLSSSGDGTMQIFSAFIAQEIPDQLQEVLRQTGFLTVALEYKAVSLVRLLRTWGKDFDPHTSYIAVDLGNAGMDFVVIREGNLYFEYFVPWVEVQGAERQITQDMFKAAFVRSLNQVINFYSQHWPGTIRELLIATPTAYETVEALVKQNFPFLVKQLELSMQPPVPPQWYTSLGSGIRGMGARSDDFEVSLLGINAQEEFKRYQLLHFLDFWKYAFPASLAVLLLAFVGALLFLRGVNQDFQQKLSIAPETNKLQELEQYETQAREFNSLVALVKNARGSSPEVTDTLAKVHSMAQSNGVSINRFVFNGYKVTSMMTGEAKSYEEIVNFKKALESDSQFSQIVLPISQTNPSAQGTSFSISFSIAAPAASNT